MYRTLMRTVMAVALMIGGVVAANAAGPKITDPAKVDSDYALQGEYSGTFEDNGEAVFGFGSDFKIYHDGSNTYLDNSIGDVYLRQNGTENSAKFIKNGGVELYYNDSKKFETTNTGFGGLGYKSDPYGND